MDTDTAWKKWGKQDPYYGVLSDNKFRKEQLTDHRAEFIQSGERHWAEVKATINTLYGYVPDGRAADFGCGVARILSPMAKDFRQSVGIDVSAEMIAEARKNSPESEFILSDDQLSALTGRLDMVHTFIVLQHIPPSRGMHFMALLLDRLNPGGVAAIHLTLRRPASSVKRAIYFLKHRLPGARLVFNILQGKPLGEPTMQMNEYDLQAVANTFQNHGMRDIYMQPHVAGGTFGVIIFARKSL